jgi:hypothetical protein
MLVKLTRSDSVNVYVSLGPKSTRLLRLSQDDIEKSTFADPIECTFPAPKCKKGKKQSKADQEDEEDDEDDGVKGKKKASTAKKPRAPPKKKTKKPTDEEKDIPSDSGSADEDLLDVDDESDHEFDGIESSSEAEGEWKVEATAGAGKDKRSTGR